MAAVAAALADLLPDDAIVFDEALTNSPALTRWLPPSRPGHFFQTPGGTLGVGIPGAVGAKLAHPVVRWSASPATAAASTPARRCGPPRITGSRRSSSSVTTAATGCSRTTWSGTARRTAPTGTRRSRPSSTCAHLASTTWPSRPPWGCRRPASSTPPTFPASCGRCSTTTAPTWWSRSRRSWGRHAAARPLLLTFHGRGPSRCRRRL